MDPYLAPRFAVICAEQPVGIAPALDCPSMSGIDKPQRTDRSVARLWITCLDCPVRAAVMGI
jgi:hypothetical protein